MDAIRNDVISLVGKELNSANEKFPPFNSEHEGYAVLKEEFEECFDEIVNAQGHMAMLWKNIKENKCTYNSVISLCCDAVNIAVESIQMAAMCQKFYVMKDKDISDKLGDIIDKEEQRIRGD